jgi:hypothetical protein
MELLEGETLAARLTRAGTLSPAELLPIVKGLCEALGAAHAGGVIHRDIKPSNIHLSDGDPQAPVKLVDFGVARVRGFETVTSSGLAVGTVRYMAPEQLSGGAVDERADLYALGIVIYEALTGEHPFERTGGDDLIGTILVGRTTPLSSLRPDLPPSVTQVVHRAMARLATDRFASTAELARAFERAVLHPEANPFVEVPLTRVVRVHTPTALGPTALAPISLRPPPAQAPVRPKKRRASALWLLLFVPVIAVVCGGAALGAASIAGCQSYLTDLQIRLGLQKLRGTIDEHPELGHHRADLERFAAMHRDERIGFLAAAAFNARFQYVIRGDDRVDPQELAYVMDVVRDIMVHEGRYDMEQYQKMTQGTQ